VRNQFSVCLWSVVIGWAAGMTAESGKQDGSPWWACVLGGWLVVVLGETAFRVGSRLGRHLSLRYRWWRREACLR